MNIHNAENVELYFGRMNLFQHNNISFTNVAPPPPPPIIHSLSLRVPE
jgi:hypothetical protein